MHPTIRCDIDTHNGLASPCQRQGGDLHKNLKTTSKNVSSSKPKRLAQTSPLHLSSVHSPAIDISHLTYSPYEILFGAPMRLPIDLARGPPPTDPPFKHFKNRENDYPLQLREQLRKIHQEVRQNIQAAARRMKTAYDQTSMSRSKWDKPYGYTRLPGLKGEAPSCKRAGPGPG